MFELITISPQRYFGPITSLVTIEEHHYDRQTITQHPVEQGAQISDHAYDEPAEVQIRFGASNSSPETGGNVVDIYQQIIDLKKSRTLFDIQTGKRLYNNMLIQVLEVTTDEKTEAALALLIICREVIIVQTQVTTVPPADSQSNPKKTAATANNGTKQAQSSNAKVPSWSEADLAANA